MGLAAAPHDGARLDSRSSRILHAVLLHGELKRGAAGAASGYAPRKAGMLIKQLLAEELLLSDSPKGSVRLGFPGHASPYLFPDLVPRSG